MTIIALDLATKTGYAMLRADIGRIESGTVNFSPKSKDRPGMRWINFRRWLVEMKGCYPDLSTIFYEDVRRHVGTQAAHVYGGLKACVEAFGEHHSLTYTPVGVGVWKKRFTGNGAARKEHVIDQCRRMGFDPQDDNEADALGILHYATDRCPILTPKFSVARKPKLAASLRASPF